MQRWMVLPALAVAVILMSGIVTPAHGSIQLTFETEGAAGGEGGSVGKIGIADFGTSAIFAKKDTSTYAFQGSGGVVDRATNATGGVDVSTFGSWLITDPVDTSQTVGSLEFFTPPGTITVDFDIPVTDVSFWVFDVNQADKETMTAKIFDGAIQQAQISFSENDRADAGDKWATLVEFNNSDPIDRLTIAVTHDDNPGSGIVGWGVDNMTFAPIPEPASLIVWSLLIGLTWAGGAWRFFSRRRGQ